ncbi:MAG: hypothetical protein PHW50_02180 [Patescibacteria group bacterium]|nr:hypothetical protein [Patescibacteria group bacterium]
MKKIKFDKVWTINELSTLEDQKFIEVLFGLLNKRPKIIISHYNDNQLHIDILDFDKNVQYEIASECWYKSLEFFPDGKLSQEQVKMVIDGENLMIADFVCKATNKNLSFQKISSKILSNYSDKNKKYFHSLILKK